MRTSMLLNEASKRWTTASSRLGAWASRGRPWRVGALLAAQTLLRACWSVWWSLAILSLLFACAVVALGGEDILRPLGQTSPGRFIRRGWRRGGKALARWKSTRARSREGEVLLSGRGVMSPGNPTSGFFAKLARALGAVSLESLSWALGAAAAEAMERRPELDKIALRWGRNPLELWWFSKQSKGVPMWFIEGGDPGEFEPWDAPAAWACHIDRRMGWGAGLSLSCAPWRTVRAQCSAQSLNCLHRLRIDDQLAAWERKGQIAGEAKALDDWIENPKTTSIGGRRL